jgi:succinate dehydrogenase hydrophobic anchor subunit
MRQLFLFAVIFYGITGLFCLISDTVKKKSIKFTKKELMSVLFRTLGYGTVVLIMTYVYWFFGIKME